MSLTIIKNGVHLNLTHNKGKEMYLGNFAVKRRINLVQLADLIFNDLNIKRNDVVMVNMSLRNINLIDSHPEDLIHLLKMVVGTQGTLLMPTSSENKYRTLNPDQQKKVRKDNIHFNLISESFRLMHDTIQSCLPGESFAAWGRMAKRITEDHCISEHSSPSNDLFYKLSLFKVKVIGIGVPLKDISFGNVQDRESISDHSESIKKSTPDSTREKLVANYPAISDIIKSMSPCEITEFFAEAELKVFKKSGILFFCADSEKVYKKTLVESKCGTTS